jgi:hypothetical protein
VTPDPQLATLALILGVHAVVRLSSRIRTRLARESRLSHTALVGEASRLGCLWGLAPFVAALFVAGSIEESEGMAAAATLLALVGGATFAAYGFALGLGCLLGFFHFRPDRPDSPWPRQALATGLGAGGIATVLGSVPFVVPGAELPAASVILVSISGVCLFSVAITSAVFWRTRASRPSTEPASPGPIRRSGVQTVLVLGFLWALVVPMSVLRLYGWLDPGVPRGLNPALEPWGLPIWLVPAALVVGAWRGAEPARKLGLGVSLLAVVTHALHAVGGLATGDSFVVWSGLFVLLVFAWPLWYLSREELRTAFRK